MVKISDQEVTERNLVIRILEGVAGGYYPNAWFFYENLPKVFKTKFTYNNVSILFNELEWNLMVIEIDRIDDSTAYCPWIALGSSLPKKVVKYKIRPEFQLWHQNPKIIDAIIDNIQYEVARIELDPRQS